MALVRVLMSLLFLTLEVWLIVCALFQARGRCPGASHRGGRGPPSKRRDGICMMITQNDPQACGAWSRVKRSLPREALRFGGGGLTFSALQP